MNRATLFVQRISLFYFCAVLRGLLGLAVVCFKVLYQNALVLCGLLRLAVVCFKVLYQNALVLCGLLRLAVVCFKVLYQNALVLCGLLRLAVVCFKVLYQNAHYSYLDEVPEYFGVRNYKLKISELYWDLERKIKS